MPSRDAGQAEAAVSDVDDEDDEDADVVLEVPSALLDAEPSDDVVPSDDPSDEEPPEPLAARLLAEA